MPLRGDLSEYAPLDAGLLSDRIIIEVKTETQDSFGATVETWSSASFSPVWAEYQGLGSREFPVLQKRQTETTARFIIRYRSDIHAATHRIKFDNKIWNISEPIHDRKRRMTTIEANEII